MYLNKSELGITLNYPQIKHFEIAIKTPNSLSNIVKNHLRISDSMQFLFFTNLLIKILTISKI